MFVPLTPLSFKRRAVTLYGGKVGVVDGDRRFTYAEFGERTQRLANALQDMGLEPGGRVAYLSYNSYPLLEGYYGVLEAGGILLPINIRLSTGEIAYILNNSDSSVLLADRDFAPIVETVLPDLDRKPAVVWLTGRPAGADGPLYDEMLDQASPSPPPPRDIDENDVAELFYTSGTTGRPKGVMLTHRNLALHALGCLAFTPVTDREVQLHTIPLFHVNGWGTPQYVTAMGGTHVMMRRFDPAEALRLVEQERVTRFLVVPTMLNMILNHPDVGKHDLSSLELIFLGGAPAPPEMISRTERVLGCKVQAGYGLSETTPVLSGAIDKVTLHESEEQRLQRRSCAGLPGVDIELRLVGPDGGSLPWDGESRGELAVRSNVVMKGYWNDPEATAAVIRDGWFHTGDIAAIDPEGYIHIVDRAKDIIISGGENISSVEIEKVLCEHPAVLESAVIPVPDDRWGEVPLALVALRPGQTATAEELFDFCRGRLAGFKVPKTIEFRDVLPKGGTGKILKRELREPYWHALSKRVH
jgi:fatty-acyl-CoA synthase